MCGTQKRYNFTAFFPIIYATIYRTPCYINKIFTHLVIPVSHPSLSISLTCFLSPAFELSRFTDWPILRFFAFSLCCFAYLTLLVFDYLTLCRFSDFLIYQFTNFPLHSFSLYCFTHPGFHAIILHAEKFTTEKFARACIRAICMPVISGRACRPSNYTRTHLKVDVFPQFNQAICAAACQ